jgi:flagellar basal-body rod protein FlgC
MDIAATGMTAQRMRMDAIASNIANAEVTNVDGNGSPYLRKHVTMGTDPERSFEKKLKEATRKLRTSVIGHIDEMDGVTSRSEITPFVKGTETDLPNMKKNVVYDPSHPDADAEGYVTFPDVNPIEEMVDLMVASRSFEANMTVLNASKQMIMKSLDI